MKRRDSIYKWWKSKPKELRQPLVFVGGMLLVFGSPLVGLIPGPGGIIVFLAGIAALGSEFDWAAALRDFFTKTVPSEMKKRWQPTPIWEIAFDISCVLGCLITASLIYYHRLLPALTILIASISLFIFNRRRLDRLESLLRRISSKELLKSQSSKRSK